MNRTALASSGARLSVYLLLLGLAMGCQGPTDELLQPGPEDAAEFYGDTALWHIDLRIDENDLNRLRKEPRVYVSGDIRIGDVRIEDVGIRLKGAYSFQGLNGKPSFKIKFNHFQKDQHFLGLKKLTLNNMGQDRSEVHEWLAYRVFRAAGVPASRTSYARITLNSQLYGLYANIETVDDRFLRDRFGSVGNLYEASWGADLEPGSTMLYEQDEGEDHSRADLAELVLRVAQPGDDIFFARNSPLDTDKFLRFMASEALVGHWDGYWKSNNYFLYHDLDSLRWSFHPWGLDQTFDRELQPFMSAGVLAAHCMTLPSCKAEYARVGVQVAQAIEQLDLASDLDALSERLAEYIDNDPRSPHPIDKTLRFQSITEAHLETVPGRLREHFACIEDGIEQDRDGDGFLGCERDCNDANDQQYPGATEICDGLDNNCDGRIDEVGCDCEGVMLAEVQLYFCRETLNWVSARDGCVARGLRLASLQEEGLSQAAFAFADDFLPNQSWYLAANDRSEEGAWRMNNDEPLHFSYFTPGEPDDFGDEDCAVLASYAGGQWADERCAHPFSYICEEIL